MTAAYLVPETIQKPTALFRGLRFEEDAQHSCSSHGSLCYCYFPEYRYNREGRKVPPPADKVFMVFVNEDQEIYNWAWANADLDSLTQRKHLPAGYQDRFKEQLF